MLIFNGTIVHDGKLLQVYIEADAELLKQHLLTVYQKAFSKAAKTGHAKSKKLGRSLTMTASLVGYAPIQHHPDQTIHITTK